MSTDFNDKDPLAIAFGRGHLALSLPPEAAPTLVRKRKFPKLKDAGGKIAQALNAPIGSAPLRELARGKQSACILICDITRPVPNQLFLRPMIENLIAAGVPLERIPCSSRPGCIVRTRATSWPSWSAIPGCSRKCGSRIISRATTPSTSISASPRTRGTPVKIDRRFVEADLRIATGLVEPHFMAGYSGGRKVDRAGRGARRDDPHLPFRALHGGPAGGPVQPRRQSAARGAARDRAHARRVYALNTVIDEDRDLVCVNFRRGHREPSGRGGIRRAAAESPGRPRNSGPSSPPPPAIRSTRPTTRRSRAW